MTNYQIKISKIFCNANGAIIIDCGETASNSNY